MTMTREEAIEILWRYDVNFEPHPPEEVMHAIDMAIEALQREEAEEKGYCHRIRPKVYSTSAEEHIAEPSDDLISREKAIDEVLIWGTNEERNGNLTMTMVSVKHRIADILSALPSADTPQEYNLETIADIVRQLGHLDSYIADTCDRPKGEWIDVEHEPYCECSVCGAYIEKP